MIYEDYTNRAGEILKDGEWFYLQTIEGIGKLWISILWVSITIFLSLYEKLEKEVLIWIYFFIFGYYSWYLQVYQCP
jgi:hypothetical protein